MWTKKGSCVTRRDRFPRWAQPGGAPCIIRAKLLVIVQAMDNFRLDKLHVKLFAAIAGAIALLTVAAYFVFTASFEYGFIQYLKRADEVRLERMSQRLADGYRTRNGWSWIADDRERWIDMSREALGLTSATADPATGARTPQRDTPLTIDPRLMLFDEERRMVMGRSELARAAQLMPVVVDERPVGYLGYVPRPEVIASIERVYVQRQRIAFGVIAVGMVVASLLLAAGLAYWLTRRIRAIEQATNALIRGDYNPKLSVSGNDELARLAQDVIALARTLDAARSSRQQWIADIAHELRTPLSVLRAEIESLEDGVRPLDDAAVKSLSFEAQRLARLVEDLHTLSLSDLGALTYHKEPIDISEVLREILQAQARALRERGLGLELQLEPGAMVLADEARLAQVFANLLQNSLRYTDSPGTIAIHARREGGSVMIDWEDSAPGVAAEDLPRLIDRLFRVEGSRSRDGGGSGLGLAIARAIVEGHAGTLSAHASGLGGLRIAITLPAVNGRANHG
jgi:two-component system sensor histidine kinase BaeS